MKTYDLFRMVAGEIHLGFFGKMYPKPSIIVIVIEDFCDEKGNAHTSITKTAFA